ncbi:50S ribosomal protein L1 [Candidatus Woesearchaeota archaeon]|nr:50S ribosomal protein L1 [Candidatus Woesearchaeota archaeon]
MDDKSIKEALNKLKKDSPKRNFKQTIDIVFNLKDIDMKKQNIDFFIHLHKSKGKKTRVCALVAPELTEQSEKVCDTTIPDREFEKYQQNPRLIKKLADEHDFFIAQSTIMPKIATAFGRVLGPRGKMPNPKAGCIVPPNANLKQLYENLQKTLRIYSKNDPVIHTIVGKEDTEENIIIDNLKTIYDAIIPHLPNGKHNIRSIYIKYTMGKSIKIM